MASWLQHSTSVKMDFLKVSLSIPDAHTGRLGDLTNTARVLVELDFRQGVLAGLDLAPRTAKPEGPGHGA